MNVFLTAVRYADGWPPRPDEERPVTWIGPSEPPGALMGDFWWDTETFPLLARPDAHPG